MKEFTITLTAEEMKMIRRALQDRQDKLEALGREDDANKCFDLECKVWEIERAK
jgi:hypothetical protein